jgi:ATPase involved in DNA repair
MLPQKLKLTNFLSYQELDLDFRRMHIACIWGANGAGKSALLEAIAWAIWGYSRVSNEDNLIYFGAKEVKVDFSFQLTDQQFRIIRRRIRGGSISLEWQTKYQDRWQSLTAKNVKFTQQAIIDCLKMDYDTFVNSAYLRQGKADEFMLKRPSDRKQVLAEILNLGVYEQLVEKAKDVARTAKGAISACESQLAHLHQQIERTSSALANLEALQQEQAELQSANQTAETFLQARQQAEQQLRWLSHPTPEPRAPRSSKPKHRSMLSKNSCDRFSTSSAKNSRSLPPIANTKQSASRCNN